MSAPLAGTPEWWAGSSWGLVRDLNAAREVIRRCDPALGLLLDTLAPVPPCPHRAMQVRTDYGELPRWKCRGCGEPMRSARLGRFRLET